MKNRTRSRNRITKAIASIPQDAGAAPAPVPGAYITGISAADHSTSRGYVYFPNLTGKTQLRELTLREARKRSQWAAWNIPPARKATRDLARWVGAVRMIPATADEAFNDAALEWWTETYEKRPGNYDASRKFTASGFLTNALFSVFRDGDLLAIHATAPDGSPTVISVESALIANPATGAPGEWNDGVKLGPHYSHQAYHIRSDADWLTTEGPGQSIPAEMAHMFANFETHSSTRGTPSLIHAIPQLLDYREIDNDVRKILKVHGLVGFAIERENGAVSGDVQPVSGKMVRENLADRGTQTTVGTSSPSNIPRNINQVFDNGEVVNMPAGAKIKTINDGRDFPAQAALKADIYHQIAMGLGVPVELLFMLDKLTGPGVRFVLQQAQEWREYWLDQQVKFLTVDYVRRIEWAIRTRQIPRPKDPKWWRHTVNYPRAVTIDAGRDAAAQDRRLKSGLTNWQTEYGEQGMQWKHEVRQRVTELKEALAECERQGVPPHLFFQDQMQPEPTPEDDPNSP